jgi:hypothetical protein
MGGTACEIARLASTKPCESASERSAAAQTTIPLRRDSFALAVGAGLLLSIPIWVVGQDLGQLYSGQATDPGSARSSR